MKWIERAIILCFIALFFVLVLLAIARAEVTHSIPDDGVDRGYMDCGESLPYGFTRWDCTVYNHLIEFRWFMGQVEEHCTSCGGTGSSDFSRQDLGKYLARDIWFFYEHDSFLDYIKGLFVTKPELDDRLYEVEAKCYLGEGASDTAVTKKAAMIKAKDTGQTVYGDGWFCTASTCGVTK